MDIWKQCQGSKYIKSLQHHAWRVVEGQNSGSGTRKLVNTSEAHEILEEELEQNKPEIPRGAEFSGLHYLLSTPFRYPELEWGSRFGTYLERSIWYGSLDIKTAFAEIAFYQLLFFKDVKEKLNANTSQKTAYMIEINTSKGVELEKMPFNEYKAIISQKDSCQYSQLLGRNMRESAVQAFTYCSARHEQGINMGVFTPLAFARKSPSTDKYQHWTCYNDGTHVEFTTTTGARHQQYAFNRDDYLIAGALPFDHDLSRGTSS